MSTKAKKTASKRRLALPATLIKNLEEARRNFKTAHAKGAKEVEKLVNRVIEIDFVKQVRKNDVVRKAAKVGNEFSREFEHRIQKLVKEIEVQAKGLRELVPVPTRSEVEKLGRKVNELSRRLDEIADEKEAASS